MIMKKEEMKDLGRFFINGLAYNGEDPVKKYILKNKMSIVQKTKAKSNLMACLKTAKRMKARKASRDELLRLVTYAYLLLETEEYTLDLDRAKEDFKIRELETKYAA